MSFEDWSLIIVFSAFAVATVCCCRYKRSISRFVKIFLNNDQEEQQTTRKLLEEINDCQRLEIKAQLEQSKIDNEQNVGELNEIKRIQAEFTEKINEQNKRYAIQVKQVEQTTKDIESTLKDSKEKREKAKQLIARLTDMHDTLVSEGLVAPTIQENNSNRNEDPVSVSATKPAVKLVVAKH